MIEKTFPKVVPTKKISTQPGKESEMTLKPVYMNDEYITNGKRLQDKVAIITGGDSGIGRATSIAYSREGAKVAIVYFNEDDDANETASIIKNNGGQCILIKGDIGDENFAKSAIETVMSTYRKIDIIVSNAGEQHPQDTIDNINLQQLERTFKTNFYGAFFIIKYGVKYLQNGASIIITTSITAFQGHEKLIDYSATKGALTSFMKSLALNLANKGIRVNAIAPGPIWTPLIPSTFSAQELQSFGSKTAFKRPGQPVELAEAYVFLASQGASFITGETIHINGGEIVN